MENLKPSPWMDGFCLISTRIGNRVKMKIFFFRITNIESVVFVYLIFGGNYNANNNNEFLLMEYDMRVKLWG